MSSFCILSSVISGFRRGSVFNTLYTNGNQFIGDTCISSRTTSRIAELGGGGLTTIKLFVDMSDI